MHRTKFTKLNHDRSQTVKSDEAKFCGGNTHDCEKMASSASIVATVM